MKLFLARGLLLPAALCLSAALCLPAALCLLACDRTPDLGTTVASPRSSAVPKGDEGKVAPKVPEPPVQGPFQHSKVERIVAIGDLHGDLSATRRAFRLAGAIDESDSWIGQKLVIVQTGDQVDRGDDDALIIAFLRRTADQATSAGGAVHVLNGNHETMNVLGDFRYVTPGALGGFESWGPDSPQAKNVPTPFQARARAFLPGGGIALELAKRPLIVMVGDTLFAHGGVLPAHVKYGIDRLNAETASWMRGERAVPPAPVLDPDGPLWTRVYGDPTLKADVCKILDKTLTAVGARRLVVGHTVQERGVTSACSERVFRIDVGLSRYYGGRSAQVLEITESAVRVITAP